MGRSIEEQIRTKCIHFNGMMNKECKAGVKYEDVRDKEARPYRVPCLKVDKIGNGSIQCPHAQFPTEEEVKKRVEEIEQSTNGMLEAYVKVKQHHKETGEMQGKIECHCGKGNLSFRVAEVNGHIWGKCDTCEIGWMQ